MAEEWLLENLHTEDWGTHLVNFRRWLSEQPKERGKGNLSDNSTLLYTNAIRGYLVYIGASLSLSRIQREILSKVESMPQKDYPFNVNVKEQLLRVANPIEDYIVCAGVSFGLRVGDFLSITRGMLEPLIHMEAPIQLPQLITKKEGVRAYPFIDQDAKEAIQNLLRLMNNEGRTDNTERMTNFSERQLNETLRKLFDKANIPLGEFRVRFHILRKFLTDRLASVCSEDKWKHFVGKSAKTPYVGAEGRDAYKKVMEFTNVNHENIAMPEEIQQLRDTVKMLREENRLLKETVSKLSMRLEGIQYLLTDELGIPKEKVNNTIKSYTVTSKIVDTEEQPVPKKRKD